MARKQLYLNGTGTGSYGIYISSDTYLNAPAVDFTAYQVPGRSGDLLQYNKRLNNIIRKFDCYIPREVVTNFDAFKKLLYSNLGYFEITSDYDPDTFQRGYLAEDIETEPFNTGENQTVKFTLYFSCEPQKYFTTDMRRGFSFYAFNVFGVYFPRILPRSHRIIQDMLQMLPPGDTPKDNAFAIFPTYGHDGGMSFSMSGYSGFVAIVGGGDFRYPDGARVTSIRAYSINGVIADTTTGASGESNTALILPGTAAGYTNWKISESQTAHWTMGSRANFTKSDAVGVGYTFKINGEFGRGNSELLDNDPARTFYLVGSVNGEPTFAGTFDLNTKPFLERAAVNTLYPVTITIDSRDLTVAATFNGERVEIGDYVGVYGELDGVADRVDLYYYYNQANGHEFTPLYINSFDVTATWWKV